MGTRGWRLGAVAGVAVLAAICASGSEVPEQPRTVSEDGPLPADRYQATPQDAQQAERAAALLVRQCMAGRGHPDFPLDPRYPTDPLVVVSVATSYGAVDLDAARRWGYGWDPAGKSAVAEPQGRRMTAVEFADLPACNDRANRRLMRGIDAQNWLYASTRAVEVDKAVARDPRLRAAWDAWSRCVADQGFTRYPDPAAAYTDHAWQRGSDGNTQHSQRERDTAVADVLCKIRHHTVDLWRSVKAEQQTADIARHRAGYTTALRQLRTYRANIADVLRTSG
ncbi:hypothetical protein [Streptomyces sp. NPDC020917]|uniref:hypothetical protein n=1 Tax=Streptomyces sp. NPDC020917 TaxID=3365102 RepID=UPI0037B27FB5